MRDDFGMWLNLDEDDRGLPASVGAAIATVYPRIVTFRLEAPTAETAAESDAMPADGEAGGTPATRELQTIADVTGWERKRIATLAGLRVEAVQLGCRIETEPR